MDSLYECGQCECEFPVLMILLESVSSSLPQHLSRLQFRMLCVLLGFCAALYSHSQSSANIAIQASSTVPTFVPQCHLYLPCTWCGYTVDHHS